MYHINSVLSSRETPPVPKPLPGESSGGVCVDIEKLEKRDRLKWKVISALIGFILGVVIAGVVRVIWRVLVG